MYARRADGASLYWRQEGKGPPVVLSHGLFCDLRIYDALAIALVTGGWSVVRWDARAHGRSSRGARPVFADLVDDLLAVVTASGAERPVLVGDDSGALVSLAAGLANPSRWAALSLWSVDAAPTPFAHGVSQALLAAARQVSIRPITLALEPWWVRRSSDGHDAAVAVLHRRTANSLSASALADVVAAVSERPDLRPHVRELPMPVQVLWGDRDWLVRPNAGRELLVSLPHAEGGPVPDAAHLVQIDRPDVVSEQLLGFLSRLSGRA